VHGIAGSAPYIAPEEWKQDQDYLPTKVDIWACGKFDVLNQY
jgi:serine/threonine protein kinase